MAVDSNGRPIAVAYPPCQYQLCLAGATTILKTGNGATADYIENLICVVATPATAQVQLQDGSGAAFTVFPNSPAGGIGTYSLKIQAKSISGAWKVIAGAGVSVVATGVFT